MSDQLLLPEIIETIPEALMFWAERTPNAPALCSTNRRELSHGELHHAIDRISNRLLALGIEREQRVALVIPAGFDMCVAMLGTMAAAVAMPLSPASSAAELTRDVERLRPELVVTGGPPEVMTREVAALLAIPVMTTDDLLAPTA